jgi:hypothetical protein
MAMTITMVTTTVKIMAMTTWVAIIKVAIIKVAMTMVTNHHLALQL